MKYSTTSLLGHQEEVLKPLLAPHPFHLLYLTDANFALCFVSPPPRQRRFEPEKWSVFFGSHIIWAAEGTIPL